MTMYPIVMQSHPQRDDVLHRFEIVEGDTEGSGFELISTWLKLPMVKNTTDTCPLCGAISDIPDGSLESHLKKYQVEHEGRDAIVRIVYRHKGPAPFARPPGRTVVTDPSEVISFKDYIKMQEASNQDS